MAAGGRLRPKDPPYFFRYGVFDYHKVLRQRWLTVYVKPKTRPASYANYKDVARNHIIPALGNIPLQKLTTDAIQEFYNRKSENGRLDGKGALSPRIIHLIHQVVNGALKQAVRQKLITPNPAEYTTRPGLKYRKCNPWPWKR